MHHRNVANKLTGRFKEIVANVLAVIRPALPVRHPGSIMFAILSYLTVKVVQIASGEYESSFLTFGSAQVAYRAVLTASVAAFALTFVGFWIQLVKPPAMLALWPRKYGFLAACDIFGGVLATGGITITVLLLRNKTEIFPDSGKILWAIVPVVYFSFLNCVPVRILARAIHDPFVTEANSEPNRESLRKAFLDDRKEIHDTFTKVWGAVAVLVVASYIQAHSLITS